MPFVDLVSGKIYGCKKGSRAWYHEKAHIQFDKSEFGTRIKYYHDFFRMLVIIVLPFNLFIDSLLLKAFTLLCGLSVVSTYLLEEIWCEFVSFKRTRHR